ncbi:MAG: SDR family NAD(P)-dependent oxidoreductase [Clostridia bacterium]|nr:SDR family NAD(P)-dependent oxidoreductase [Clostridia bacterium]
MAKEGADVALIARNRERLDEAADQIRALGRKAVVIEADVTDAEGIKKAVETAIEELGGLDVFHCNAGIYYLRCPAKDLRMDQIRKLMEVDYFGCLNCVYAVLPYFLEKKSGSIVTTCSMDGKKGVPPDAGLRRRQICDERLFPGPPSGASRQRRKYRDNLSEPYGYSADSPRGLPGDHAQGRPRHGGKSGRQVGRKKEKRTYGAVVPVSSADVV